MTLEQVVLWIVIGGIAGLIAEAIIRDVRVGLVGTVIIGILGALLGGWLFGVLKIHIGTGIISDVIEGVVGAVVLLLIMRGFRRL